MPCYTIREVSVEFKVSNIELLKKAIAKVGFSVVNFNQTSLRARQKDGLNSINIDLEQSKITSQSFNANQLNDLSNQLKRSYSEVVISEVAQKQKWIAKKLSDRKFQLVKY